MAGVVFLWSSSFLAMAARGTETIPPPGIPAALVVHLRNCETQPAAVHALVLPWVLRGFQSHEACAEVAESYTVLAVKAAGERSTIGVAQGPTDLRGPFGALRSRPATSIAGYPAYSLRRSPLQIVLVDSRKIVEGDPPALGRYLKPAEAPSHERRLLASTLRTSPSVPSAATLLYLADEDDAGLVDILADFDAMWPGLARLSEPYAAPMKLVGSMRGGRADVWQDGDSLRVRILFVSQGSMDAKRSVMALRMARGLAPMASDAAVHAGTLAPGDAQLLTQILESMRMRTDEEKIHVDLAVPTSAVLSPR